MKYNKAYVAATGAAITAALGILPPDTLAWRILTVISAAVTTLGVYAVSNGVSRED